MKKTILILIMLGFGFSIFADDFVSEEKFEFKELAHDQIYLTAFGALYLSKNNPEAACQQILNVLHNTAVEKIDDVMYGDDHLSEKGFKEDDGMITLDQLPKEIKAFIAKSVTLKGDHTVIVRHYNAVSKTNMTETTYIIVYQGNFIKASVIVLTNAK